MSLMFTYEHINVNEIQTDTTQTASKGPMSIGEFNVRVSDLTLRYGENVALRMARRERKARHPLRKRATARRASMADTAIEMTGTFHPL